MGQITPELVVRSLSRVWLFVTPWTAACQASLFFTVSQSLLKLMSIESLMLSNHLILCHPLFLLPSIFPSISVFQCVGSSHQEAKVLELQLQHQSFQWIFGADFLLDWLIWSPCSPGTLKSLLQHHNLKSSIFWCSALFMVQLSYLYNYWKNLSLNHTDFGQQIDVSAF